MLSAQSVQRQVDVRVGIPHAVAATEARLNKLGATNLRHENGVVQCRFGNYALSRLVGTGFIKKHLLPKDVAVGFQPLEDGATRITVVVRPIYGSSLRVGVPRRMQSAIETLADQIEASYFAS